PPAHLVSLCGFATLLSSHPMGRLNKRTKANRANLARGHAVVAATTAAAAAAAAAAASTATATTEAEGARSAAALQVCEAELQRCLQALQRSENEVQAVQVALHRSQAELAAIKQELSACQAERAATKQELTASQSKVRSMATQLAAVRAQLATATWAMPKDVRDKMSWLQRNEVSLYTLKRWHAMRGAPPCTQAASPATALKAPPPPLPQGANAALLTLPNVSCQQLGPLRTAVAAAEFPDAPPQPQAGPSTVRRHQLMLTCDIQRTFEGLLRQAPAIHIQMDGCTITSGKVVLYCASAAIPAAGPRLPTLAADPPTPAQILTHGQEPSRILCRVLDIRKCLDSTAAAQAQDLEQLLTEANLWGLLASVTVDSAASNVGRTGGIVALVNEQRDMERASAAKTAVARATRKAVMESCMVGGNKQLVLNIGTVASLGQLRAASSRHPRGADYSATTLEEAAAFTLAQLWGYINFYKIPPKHRPAQKTLLHNLRRFVKQHIEQRTKAALSSGPGGVA
ncbi:hypothetical protein QJQ45_023492, partial [Haematococcus lacustris]